MDRNYWLHRISYVSEASYPLLGKENLLTIGFSDVANQAMVDVLAKGDTDAFTKIIQDKYGSSLRARWSFWAFAHDMQVGDIVVVPRPWEFRVYRIVSDVQWTNAALKEKDLGWQRKVEPLTGWLSRSDHADAALTKRLKYFGTTVKISDLCANIENAVANKSVNVFQELSETTVPSWLRLIKSQMNPDKLERLVQWYLWRAGADDVRILAKNGSGKVGDCDVEAVFETIRTIINVQVKKHEGVTDAYAVNQIKDFSDAVDHDDPDYIRARWVISTAEEFNNEAKETAREKRILLLNGSDFVRLLLRVGVDESMDV